MDSGILMQQDSILVCSPNLRIPHTANVASMLATKKQLQNKELKNSNSFLKTAILL
jgi:hypothetical protein